MRIPPNSDTIGYVGLITQSGILALPLFEQRIGLTVAQRAAVLILDFPDISLQHLPLLIELAFAAFLSKGPSISAHAPEHPSAQQNIVTVQLSMVSPY